MAMFKTSGPTRMLGDVEAPATGTWVFDPEHTRFGFIGRHLMVTKVRGVFHEWTGKVVIGETPEESSVEVALKAATVETGVEMRDKNLRSANFFEVEKYPEITFKSTKVEPTGKKTLRLTGDLTVKEVSRPLTLDVEYNGVVYDPADRVRASFSAEAEILREDWGLTWNQAIESGGFLVGPKVKIEIDVEIVPENQE